MNPNEVPVLVAQAHIDIEPSSIFEVVVQCSFGAGTIVWVEQIEKSIHVGGQVCSVVPHYFEPTA
jgi:2-keto-3-deoxy-6-phosphogluconate aldolase